MASEVVEAKWHHCGALARKIRDGRWLAYKQAGIDLRAQLHGLWGESFLRRSWMDDGHILAMGGLKGTLLSRSAHVWLAIAPEVEARRFAFIRILLAEEGALRQHQLTSTIAEQDGTAIRFARWFGFVEDGPPVQIGETGVFVIPFVLRR